jgi:hypothetical protein
MLGSNGPAQVLLRDHPLTLQQMDVQPGTPWLSLSPLRHYPPHVRPVCARSHPPLLYARAFPA